MKLLDNFHHYQKVKKDNKILSQLRNFRRIKSQEDIDQIHQIKVPVLTEDLEEINVSFLDFLELFADATLATIDDNGSSAIHHHKKDTHRQWIFQHYEMSSHIIASCISADKIILNTVFFHILKYCAKGEVNVGTTRYVFRNFTSFIENNIKAFFMLDSSKSKIANAYNKIHHAIEVLGINLVLELMIKSSNTCKELTFISRHKSEFYAMTLHHFLDNTIEAFKEHPDLAEIDPSLVIAMYATEPEFHLDYSSVSGFSIR